MSSAKVIPLASVSKKRSPLAPILHTVRQKARKQLSTLLEGLFNNVDDALFEMADRSRNDIDQHLYFESMRELRLNRDAICKTFSEKFSAGFDEAFIGSKDQDEDFENISMVGNDELEISVAVAGIVSKVTSQHSLLVMQLTKRLDHLAGDVELTERKNPLGPEMLSEVFVSALECAEIDIKIRIILLKLYERFVMERLADLYAQANQQLSEAGVLTDLKKTTRAPRSQRTRPEPASGREPLSGHSARGAAGPASSAPVEENFRLIQNLLAATRSGDVSTGDVLGRSGPDGVAELSTTDVLSALSSAQNTYTAPIDVETVPAILDLRQLVVGNEQSNRLPPRLGQIEEDVVNFVGMLFDYILNDRNLAIPMKALIGRLQLPIVKLAIMDRSFFEKSGHPARLLLNELSSAGIGWSSAKELKRDALYDKVEAIVLGVMNGFDDDASIFEELLEDLRTFVGDDVRKREQVEQRVKDSEQGRAQTVNAKEAVQKLINQKASGMRLPTDIGRFVSETWSKVLIYSSVKGGTRSPAWHQHTETLDELLWCLQPLDQLKDIEQRDVRIPPLLDSLRDGMEEIQLPGSELEKHVDAISTHLTKLANSDRAYLEDDEPVRIEQPLEVMEQVVLTSPADKFDVDAGVQVEQGYLDQVAKLREGSWVEMKQTSGEILRCKLSTIIDPGGRYIFVNRRGMKVAEKSRRGLAVELKRKALAILEESEVFDRALQAVIGNLRQLQRAPVSS